LVHLEGCKIVRDLEWHAGVQRWWLELELTHAARPPHLPGRTRWCLVVANDYPYGEIQMAPAKDGGLTATFPHQAVNDLGDPNTPWRCGNACVVHPIGAIGRFAELMPARDPHERLAWYVRRTLDWLDHAAHDDLLRLGDPFELPSYAGPSGRATEIVVREDSGSFARWQQSDVQVGIFEAVVCEVGTRRLVIVRVFRDLEGRPIWRLPDLNVRGTRGHTLVHGFWTRLQRPPALEPWQAPRSWKELASAVVAGGDDLQAAFGQIRPGRLGRGARFLLLGAPVPWRIGQPNAELAWQAAWIPGPQCVPSRGGRHRRVHANLVDWMSSRKALPRRVHWFSVANWAADRLEARGRLEASIRDREVVLLGAGALGSLVGELLVRGGIHRLTVIDHDDLDTGNLVRHTLLAEDLYVPKAQALARRLNGVSPHARVRGLAARVPSIEAVAAMASADVVIDCTAEDDVLLALGELETVEPKRWLSAAVGAEARSLFVFMARGRRFPAEELFACMDPSSTTTAAVEERWEGPGCWSPLFPARMDQIALMAAVVAERVQALFDRPLERSSFEVFRRRSGPDGLLEGLELERDPREARTELPARAERQNAPRRARGGRWVLFADASASRKWVIEHRSSKSTSEPKDHRDVVSTPIHPQIPSLLTSHPCR
jgi:molybdopterin/thiamine biosynthesis adenylyltransferase